jgi:hypothetical protein
MPMDLWNVLGILLLGAGVGALTTAALYVEQIRKPKELLKATRNDRHEEDRHKSDGRKSA